MDRYPCSRLSLSQWVPGLSSGNTPCSARESQLSMLTSPSLLIIVTIVVTSSGQQLGYGGLPGQRTSRTGETIIVSLSWVIRTWFTGSVWPPYPGAGQGYWARKAGFYDSGSRPKFNGFATTSRPIKPTNNATTSNTTSANDSVPVYRPRNSFKYYINNNKSPWITLLTLIPNK